MRPPPTLLCTVAFPANTGFAWDFIEHSYARMANELAPYGIRTLVAYPSVSEAPRPLAGSAARAIALDTSLTTGKSRAQFTSFVRRENVQVLYLTDRPVWSFWYPALRAAGVRRIIVHDHTSGKRSNPTGLRRIFKRAIVNTPGIASDRVIGVSDFVAERSRRSTLIRPEKVVRVWNGLDPVAAGSEDGVPDVHSLLGLSRTTPLIGCACRATPEKGVDVLFHAFNQLAAAHPDAVLAYIGSGPQLDALRELRDSLPSRDRIHLLGYLPRAATLLRSATLCVVPSVWEEAFSLAVLEMMARGCTVVASRVGGIPELIEDGVTGLLVAPNDIAALSATISKALLQDDLRRSLGSRAKVRASSRFSATNQISGMLATFRDAFIN